MRLFPCIGYVSLTSKEVGGVHEQRDYKMSTSTECPGMMYLEQANWSKCKQSVQSATVEDRQDRGIGMGKQSLEGSATQGV